MKNLLLSATFLTSALFATAASAVDAQRGGSSNSYISLKGEGIVASDSDLDLRAAAGTASANFDEGSGYGVGLMLGHALTDAIRAELEVTYRENKFSRATIGGVRFSGTGKFETITTTGNLYYDFHNSSMFTPYIGVGAGIANDTNNSTAAFAYQGMAGATYDLSDRWKLYAGYRYIGTSNFTDKENDPVLGTVTTKYDMSTHLIETGIKFTF